MKIGEIMSESRVPRFFDSWGIIPRIIILHNFFFYLQPACLSMLVAWGTGIRGLMRGMATLPR